MTLTSKSYYQVFDTAYPTQEAAESMLEGWEHKESIKTVYVVVDPETVSDDAINLMDNDYPYYSIESHALDHINEEQSYFSAIEF